MVDFILYAKSGYFRYSPYIWALYVLIHWDKYDIYAVYDGAWLD
jgi:hypothetical protein